MCLLRTSRRPPTAFDDHYERVHIPLARAVPGLVDFTWGKASSLDGSAPPYYAIASLYFADADSLNAGLRSVEMAAAAADVPKFASGGVTMFKQEERSVLS